MSSILEPRASSYRISVRGDGGRRVLFSICSKKRVCASRRGTEAERRPINDPVCVAAMLKHANLVCTAWDDSKLVGVARSLTDFEYCCYLSDLAVDEEYQRIGIGKGLIRLTQSRLGKKAKIILLAAPKAEEYYRRIGFEAHSSAWLLDAKRELA